MAQKCASKCDLCSENDGSAFCYECKQALCQSCKTIHDKIPLTKKHKVTDLNNVDRSVFQSDLGCSSHQELYTFFCKQCTCLICGTCLLQDHTGHRFCGIEEISKLARQHSEQLVSEGKRKLAELTEAIKNITPDLNGKIETDSAAVIGQITSSVHILQEIIDISRNNRVSEVEYNKYIEKEQLESTRKRLETLKNEYAIATSTFEQLLTETHDTLFYSSYTKHKNSFPQFDDIPNYKLPDKVREFDIEEFLEDILIKIQQKYSW